MNHVTHPLRPADINFFSPEISKFCYIKNTDMDCILIKKFLILLTFFETLKIVLIKMVTILMISVKMANLGLPKLNVF